MLGSHVIKSVGVLFFRADKSVSINLLPEFVEQMNRTDDVHIYRLVKGHVDGYIADSGRLGSEPEQREARARYITMAIFAHYLKQHPERQQLRRLLRASA